MFGPWEILRGAFTSRPAVAPATVRRRPRQAGLAFDNLEGRIVLSHVSPFHASVSAARTNVVSTSPVGESGGSTIHEVGSTGQGDGPIGGQSTGSGGCGGLGQGGGGSTSSSSVLGQDSKAVAGAYQAFDASYLAAVAALRQTATSTAGPSTAGVTAFDAAIATATTTLDASIKSDLANLTNTGSGLVTTIDGYTATLQAEIDSAATGLASSTSASVLAMNQEVSTYLHSAQGQTSSALLGDVPTGTLTGTTLQTFNQAVKTAYQAFNLAISNAEQAAISSGSALSTSAVSTAVTDLESALGTAVDALGTSFTSAESTLLTTVNNDLTSLTTSLTGITAPTAGNSASARVFVRAVSSALTGSQMMVGQALTSSIQAYNSSLL